MPTNLPPVNQTLLSGLQQTRTEQIASLSKLLDLSIGTTALALVEKLAPVTQAQRDLLLNQNATILAQLNASIKNPAIKVQINNLLEQQQLLNAPLLKLVQLQINGRELLTYTDKPLQLGQSIPVKLDMLQRLLQLAPAFDSTAAEQPIKSTAEQTVQKAQMQQMLATVLRHLLPNKDKPQELFAALPQLQQMPLASRNQLLSGTLQQALKTVADQLRAPQQLANPKLLAMILKNSGVQFEHKLATQLPPDAKSHPPAPPVTQRNTVAPQQNSPMANRLTTQDLKGALLQLLHRLNQELASTSTQAPTQSVSTTKATDVNTASAPLNSLLTSGAQASLTAPIPFDNLTQLLQHLASRPHAELSDKVLRTQLLLLLHQSTLSSLSKVQLQQLHTVNHQQAQADSPQPTQSWLFEIPVKHGQDVHPLEVRIDQEWLEEESDGNKGSEKIRQWSVMLTFNLPEAGGFYAQLTVLNDIVSAKLWAEHEATLAQAQKKLDGLRQQLQSQGVEVKQLQCLSGPPPRKSISLNYALVDITT